MAVYGPFPNSRPLRLRPNIDVRQDKQAFLSSTITQNGHRDHGIVRKH